MKTIGRKVGIAIVGMSLVAAAGSATVALAGDGSSPSQPASVAIHSTSPNDDGTPDQGHGDVPARAGEDNGRHGDDHHHEGGDDHGRHHGDDDHGRHHGEDDHGDDDSGHHGSGHN